VSPLHFRRLREFPCQCAHGGVLLGFSDTDRARSLSPSGIALAPADCTLTINLRD
jgi:hypothetical protein